MGVWNSSKQTLQDIIPVLRVRSLGDSYFRQDVPDAWMFQEFGAILTFWHRRISHDCKKGKWTGCPSYLSFSSWEVAFFLTFCGPLYLCRQKKHRCFHYAFTFHFVKIFLDMYLCVLPNLCDPCYLTSHCSGVLHSHGLWSCVYAPLHWSHTILLLGVFLYST